MPVKITVLDLLKATSKKSRNGTICVAKGWATKTEGNGKDMSLSISLLTKALNEIDSLRSDDDKKKFNDIRMWITSAKQHLEQSMEFDSHIAETLKDVIRISEASRIKTQNLTTIQDIVAEDQQWEHTCTDKFNQLITYAKDFKIIINPNK